MICSEIITKDNVKQYLKDIIINKRYLALIMAFFDQIKNISIHEKIMFLLYNEYISIEDLAACSNDPVTITTIEFSLSRINALISQHSDKWGNPYAFIRDVFYRDYVTTLTFADYEGIANIKNQLAIVYSSLSSEESAFLLDNFSITKNNLIDLVRLQVDAGTMELSKVEQNGELLNKFTTLLSGIKDFRTGSVVNKDSSDHASDVLKAVLKKIDQGTIH